MANSLNEAPGEAYGGEMPALTTQLMGQVKAGDEGAFDQLVNAVTPRGNTVAQTLVGSREDARDLVQESLTKIYAARESYRQEAPFLLGSTFRHNVFQLVFPLLSPHSTP